MKLILIFKRLGSLQRNLNTLSYKNRLNEPLSQVNPLQPLAFFLMQQAQRGVSGTTYQIHATMSLGYS